MLMECLAAGRSISLPASACAAAQGCVRATGAYATIREQFDMSIGRFEGIEEPLARIGGLTYLIDSMRRLTAGAVDSGEKPSVISAIAKRWSTETQRQIVNDAMDIVAGAGISQGERNVIARAYLSTPIGITVEGANILTRTLIVFGQGAIRCHPFVQTEMQACGEKNVARFDGAFWGHINFVFSNAIRSLVLGLTDGAPARPAHRHAKISRYLGRLSRLSAAFALCSDAAMGTLGGSLKGAQKLSGRLADALAYNYMASAAVKRFVDEGCKPEHEPFMDWSVQFGLYQVEEALAGFLDNLPLRPAAWALRLAVFPTGRRYKLPTDRTGSKVARALLDDRQERLDLTRDIYIPRLGEPGLGLYEEALDAVVAAQPAVRKLKEALRSRKLNKFPEQTQVARALEAGILTAEDKALMDRAEAFRDDAIQVDSFPKESFPRRPREIHASPVREAVSGRR
jgi:acyl-CoA dehydrogenase